MTPLNCFGYGSLVNLSTHDFAATTPVNVKGLRRHWNHRIHSAVHNATSLNVMTVAGAQTKGLVLSVPYHRQQHLSDRESGYSLCRIDETDLLDGDTGGAPVSVYQSNTPQNGNAEFPILQSYLDTVLLGFLTHFGPSGVRDFLTTTDGWEAPIKPDRDQPIYPRTIPLDAEQIAFFDRELAAFGVRYLEG